MVRLLKGQLRKEYKLGSYPEMGKRQADRQLEKLIADYAEGKPIGNAPAFAAAPGPDPTFNAAARKYLELRKIAWGKPHRKAITSVFDVHIISKLGTFEGRPLRVDEIKPSDVQRFFNEVAQTDPSKSLMKKCVSHTRGVFDMCIDDDVWIQRNPARAKTLKIPKRTQAIRRCFRWRKLGAW